MYFFAKSKKPWKRGIVVDISGRRYDVKSEDGGRYTKNRVHIRPTDVPVHIRESPYTFTETSERVANAPVAARASPVARAPAAAEAPETANKPTNAPATENAPTAASSGETLNPAPSPAPDASPGKYNLRPRRDLIRPQHLKDYV